MFSWEYPPHMVGGLGQHVFDLSRFLAHYGIETHIITPSVKDYPDYQEESGVHIHRVGTPAREAENFKSWIFSFNSDAIRATVKIASKVNGFQVIHAHDWLVAYAGRSISKIFGIPLVTTIHATEHGRNLGLHNRIQLEINEIERNLALEANHVICCSNYMREEICNLFGTGSEKITVIPNGVDPELFAALPEKSNFSIKKNEKVVFFLGRLVPEKGILQLVNAFSQVLAEVPEARLYIGGRGPLKSVLEKRCCELGIEEYVVFTGFIYEKERNYLYNQARVAVFPSLYEPFGIVALEAMATRTPVIVGDVGGLSEIIEEGVTGLKVKAGNEDELAKAIIRILADDDLAQSLERNANKMVRSIYSWESIAHKTAEVYEHAIAEAKLMIRKMG